MKRTFSALYAFFDPLVYASISLWHRRLVVDGVENVPDGPVLLIANHQNGMEDPLVCCVTAPRQCHFLTRADIFAKPSVDKLLRSLNMIPVYRPRDRKRDARDRNADSFARAKARLEKGCIVALFPEGNHGNRYHLRKFKTGMARIGLEALDAWSKDPSKPKDIQVVPVGLDYQNYTDFRSEFRLEYGQPFSLQPFLQEFQSEPLKAVEHATEHARKALLERIIHVTKLKRHDTIMGLRPVWRHLHFGQDAYRADLGEMLQRYQAVAARLEAINDDRFTALEATWDRYQQQAQTFGMAPHEADLRSQSLGWKLRTLVILLLGAPVFAWGALFNLPPVLLTRFVVRNKVRDPHFKSSFGFAVPAFAVPLWWLILAGVVVGALGWLYMPALVIATAASGMLALPYRDRFLRLKKALRWNRLCKRNPSSADLIQQTLQDLKHVLIEA